MQGNLNISILGGFAQCILSQPQILNSDAEKTVLRYFSGSFLRFIEITDMKHFVYLRIRVVNHNMPGYLQHKNCPTGQRTF